ncbi:MAG: hypothetical protein ACYCZF_10615 [Anaerolineae bacterium]
MTSFNDRLLTGEALINGVACCPLKNVAIDVMVVPFERPLIYRE